MRIRKREKGRRGRKDGEKGQDRKEEEKKRSGSSFKCQPGSSQGRHYIVFVERWPSDWLGPDGEAQLTR